jgi:DNA topoisomerase-2
VKYYKHTTAEAKEYFKYMKSTDFVSDEKSTDAMDLAFNKKRADDRKTWLTKYDRSKVLRRLPDVDPSRLRGLRTDPLQQLRFKPISPSAIDGLKVPSVRSCSDASRKVTSEIRVAQLADIYFESSYHHGETSGERLWTCTGFRGIEHTTYRNHRQFVKRRTKNAQRQLHFLVTVGR